MTDSLYHVTLSRDAAKIQNSAQSLFFRFYLNFSKFDFLTWKNENPYGSYVDGHTRLNTVHYVYVLLSTYVHPGGVYYMPVALGY